MEIIQKLESVKHSHVLLFHEDPKMANKIELQFIKNGLEKGDVCYYTTNDVPLIKKEMRDFGIDITKYEKILNIVEIPKKFEDYKKIILDKVFEIKKFNKKIRLVSTHYFDFSSQENSEIMSDIEQCVDDNFSEIPGTMICSFFVDKISGDHKKEFMTKLLDSHHNVIFIRKDNTPIEFNLP